MRKLKYLIIILSLFLIVGCNSTKGFFSTNGYTNNSRGSCTDEAGLTYYNYQKCREVNAVTIARNQFAKNNTVYLDTVRRNCNPHQTNTNLLRMAKDFSHYAGKGMIYRGSRSKSIQEESNYLGHYEIYTTCKNNNLEKYTKWETEKGYEQLPMFYQYTEKKVFEKLGAGISSNISYQFTPFATQALDELNTIERKNKEARDAKKALEQAEKEKIYLGKLKTKGFNGYYNINSLSMLFADARYGRGAGTNLESLRGKLLIIQGGYEDYQLSQVVNGYEFYNSSYSDSYFADNPTIGIKADGKTRIEGQPLKAYHLEFTGVDYYTTVLGARKQVITFKRVNP